MATTGNVGLARLGSAALPGHCRPSHPESAGAGGGSAHNDGAPRDLPSDPSDATTRIEESRRHRRCQQRVVDLAIVPASHAQSVRHKSGE
jgi:hypothetical protein